MSTQIRLAAGTIDGATLLSTDSYLVTNFPRQNDQPSGVQWLATQPETPTLQQVRRSLGVGSGGFYGLRNTALEIFQATPKMRQYIFNTIMQGKPVAPITAYIYDAILGFIVVTGEMTTAYDANNPSFAQGGDDTHYNTVYQLQRLTYITGAGFLLLENDDFILQENGDKLLRDT